ARDGSSGLNASASLKGPTDRMLRELGMEVSATQVAKLYADFADIFVLDWQDKALKSKIEQLGLRVFVTDTVMSDAVKKTALAKAVLQMLSK
ncbi:MAG TPA: 2-phospho-L-lactate transferase, partial [Blastocatellia bacterium]|nr:2-phospho-L-lactate transferase [Blastocatellia bacterium]